MKTAEKEYRKFVIKEETNCSLCIHIKLCRKIRTFKSFEVLCLNYLFGTSANEGCDSCTCRFGKCGKYFIPCFKCRFFEEGVEK